MTPAELAERHPQLFHVTTAGASDQIRRLGLMSTADLLALLDLPEPRRVELVTKRRGKAEVISDAVRGTFVLGDNAPLSEKRLTGRLEDGLTFSDWLKLLNDRVFFWTDRRRAESLRQSRRYRDAEKELLVVDTLALARAHGDRVEIAPFNTGATGRQPNPPVRGASTFAPLLETDYRTWRVRRGQRDRIVEVVVRGSVPDIAHFIERVETL
jgi:hypothetical protein